MRAGIKAPEIDMPQVMDEIFKKISFGVGRRNKEPVDYSVLEKIGKADCEPQRTLLDLAVAYLGTVGSGNHFVDLFVDDEGD